MKKSHFKLPESFLNQLNEFTNGYYLVIVNDEMNFETHFEFPSQVVEEGLINHVSMEIEDFQLALKDTIQGIAPSKFDFEDDDEDEDEEESEAA